MTTRTTGVDEALGISEAENLFLNRWADANEPSDTDEGENPDEDEDDATVSTDQEDESEDDTDDSDASDADPDDEDDADEDDDSDEAPLASDDHKVTVTVDGEDHTVSVKDLKRLYGQEAALTRKSQEVAAKRKALDTEGERYVVAAQTLLAKAEDRFKPFQSIDWMVAQQKLSADEFAALREEARSAYQDLQFLQAETDDVLEQVRTTRQAALAEQAKETIKVLEQDIPGWNQDVYNSVRKFAVETGMDADMVSQIVDPSALKIMHMAMSYAAIKSKAATKKPLTKPKAAPKKVVKPGSNTPSGKLGKQDKGQEATAQLRKTGHRDDAVNAFLSRWEDNSSD